MRAGETDKAVSFKDEKLFALIEKFVKECGWSGQIDIDIFDIDGEYYISEVNPRFGGGYPHAYECGCNHMKLIKNNLIGVANEKNIGAYEEGIYMMKYNEVMIRRRSHEAADAVVSISDADHTGWSETYRIFKKTECICRYWRECDDSVS